jgi:hypothetical protein
MARHPAITQDEYLKWLQFIGNWATKEHCVLLINGNSKRIHSAEVVLPRLVSKGKLKRVKYHRQWVFSVPRVSKSFNDELQIEHGLGCTEGLVRFWVSDRSGELIPERKFKGFNIRPEWAIKYPKGTILLYEFCTRDNSKRLNVLKSKILRYQAIMKKDYTILFVMDLPRESVEEIVSKIIPVGPFMFTDYETFKSIPIGEQFTTPIYIWGEDNQVHPLRYT